MFREKCSTSRYEVHSTKYCSEDWTGLADDLNQHCFSLWRLADGCKAARLDGSRDICMPDDLVRPAASVFEVKTGLGKVVDEV